MLVVKSKDNKVMVIPLNPVVKFSQKSDISEDFKGHLIPKLYLVHQFFFFKSILIWPVSIANVVKLLAKPHCQMLHLLKWADFKHLLDAIKTTLDQLKHWDCKENAWFKSTADSLPIQWHFFRSNWPSEIMATICTGKPLELATFFSKFALNKELKQYKPS